MISNFLFYLFYIAISIIVFFLDSYLGLLIVIFSYLLLFFLNYLKNKSVFNYIQFYLLSCWVLSISQVFNVDPFGDYLFYKEKVYFFCCVIITSVIIFFFKVPNKNIYLFKDQLNEINSRNFYPILVIVFFLLIFSFDGLFGSIIQYIVKNLLYIAPIVISSIIYLNTSKKTFPNILFLIAFFYYTSFNFNRTGFILVPLIFFLTVLIDKNFQFKLKENIKIYLLSILFLFILLIMSDLYKTSQARNFVNFISELKFDDLINYFEFTRYRFESKSNIYDYFSIIQKLTDDNKELGGNIFSQFLSIFKPRFFFPDKVITNISELNTMQGIIENPLFFAIFMESTYNLGLIGVLIYHFLILFIGNVMFRAIKSTNNKFLFHLFITNYFFYTVYLYILIRGPGIHFASHFLVCFILMCYYLFASKINKINVNNKKDY